MFVTVAIKLNTKKKRNVKLVNWTVTDFDEIPKLIGRNRLRFALEVSMIRLYLCYFLSLIGLFIFVMFPLFVPEKLKNDR